MGRGLAASGMSPAKNILIFAETRADWIIAALACFRQNYTGKFPVVRFDLRSKKYALGNGGRTSTFRPKMRIV